MSRALTGVCETLIGIKNQQSVGPFLQGGLHQQGAISGLVLDLPGAIDTHDLRRAVGGAVIEGEDATHLGLQRLQVSGFVAESQRHRNDRSSCIRPARISRFRLFPEETMAERFHRRTHRPGCDGLGTEGG